MKSPLAADSDAPTGNPSGFAYVKRDLIKLLGALAHKDREVQDRLRTSGGVEVILNHCVIDENNPCTCSLAAPWFDLP